MKKKLLAAALVLVGVYFGSYLGFRQFNQELWPQDGNVYVIFPENKILYYGYRPLVIVDSAITGMRFHIGPHR